MWIVSGLYPPLLSWLKRKYRQISEKRNANIAKLDSQPQECLGCLHKIPNGEGILCKTMMTVNNLGKIDVYHYICFLAQHAERHITQMEKIKIGMESK